MTHDSHTDPALTNEPAYPSSPGPPPDTTGEYLVCWRRPHWPDHRPDSRRVFHAYARADQFRRRLEAPERQAWALPTDAVFVTIHWRPCRQWREIP